MAATIIDSTIFGDMFSDARMRQVWSDENRTAKYLDIERALAKVQGELGIIPQEAADEAVRCDTPPSTRDAASSTGRHTLPRQSTPTSKLPQSRGLKQTRRR